MLIFQGVREIPQNYHTFALFDTPNMGNLMTPVSWILQTSSHEGTGSGWDAKFDLDVLRT